MKKIKTLDVIALEWRDRVNGNSYFSAQVTINYGTKTAKLIKIQWQYGYGEQFKAEAFAELKRLKIIKTEERALWSYCDKNGIILRASKHAGKKNEMIAHGKTI